jgi:hypothetical protein
VIPVIARTTARTPTAATRRDGPDRQWSGDPTEREDGETDEGCAHRQRGHQQFVDKALRDSYQRTPLPAGRCCTESPTGHLARKRGMQADAAALAANTDASKIRGAHGPAASQRSFRRKSGG